MNKTFENLLEEKRKRILDACLEEFAQNGYDKASTNTIVKKADISKGILFHYFGSKKNLYLYLFDDVMEYYTRRFFEGGTVESPDLFERLIWRSNRKIQLAYEDPVRYKFMLEAFLHTPAEVQAEITDKVQAFTTVQMPLMFKGIDTSLLRPELDPGKAMTMVALCIEALSNWFLQKYKSNDDWQPGSLETMLRESHEYLDMLKHGIYRE